METQQEESEFWDALDERRREAIALRFGRECADDVRDLILDAEESHAAIGALVQRKRQFEQNIGRAIWKAWKRFKDAAGSI